MSAWSAHSIPGSSRRSPAHPMLNVGPMTGLSRTATESSPMGSEASKPTASPMRCGLAQSPTGSPSTTSVTTKRWPLVYVPQESALTVGAATPATSEQSQVELTRSRVAAFQPTTPGRTPASEGTYFHRIDTAVRVNPCSARPIETAVAAAVGLCGYRARPADRDTPLRSMDTLALTARGSTAGHVARKERAGHVLNSRAETSWIVFHDEDGAPQ